MRRRRLTLTVTLAGKGAQVALLSGTVMVYSKFTSTGTVMPRPLTFLLIPAQRATAAWRVAHSI